jgi:hypothetical protein
VPSHVVIPTANFALGYLSENRLPLVSTANHRGHSKLLFASYMIVRKHDKINFTAIYTGMTPKVLMGFPQILPINPVSIPTRVGNVRFLVPQIPRFLVPFLTASTKSLANPIGFILPIELVNRLWCLASRANSFFHDS